MTYKGGYITDEKTGERILPRTLISLISDANGRSLTDILAELQVQGHVETPTMDFTDEQMAAINSGITEELVTALRGIIGLGIKLEGSILTINGQSFDLSAKAAETVYGELSIQYNYDREMAPTANSVRPSIFVVSQPYTIGNESGTNDYNTFSGIAEAGGAVSFQSSESWLTVNNSGYATATANPNTTERTATITATVTINGKTATATATITQAAKPEEGEETPTDGYSDEKAEANLTALRKANGASTLFAILDTNANAYADKESWQAAGSPTVLGIAYCTSTRFYCMATKRIAKKPFGGSGVSISASKATVTTDQWGTAATDKNGVGNTNAIVETYTASDGYFTEAPYSIAGLCREKEFVNGKRGYLPAYNEISVYCNNHSAVNALLTAVGGDKLYTLTSGSESIWTSTLYNSTTAWVCLFGVQSSQPKYVAKSGNYYARVFIEI